jgi:L-ascorbate metabolism protein UlaG (beta-lactamase superfamily)
MTGLVPPAIALLAAAAIAACVTGFPYADPAKPHRAAEGFRNNYPHPEKSGFWRWKWEQWRDGVPKEPPGGWRFEVASADAEALRARRHNPGVTWIGHATLLVQVGGLNVLTDPIFSERASPVPFAGPKRVVPPEPAPGELPHIDAVVISHDHYDHLDIPSVRLLAAQPGGSPRFFVGLGLKRWFEARGIADVVELDWWERTEFKGLDLHFVPVQHWAKRTLWDENQRLWGGWVLRHPEFSFFFAGDAGYSRDFADIGARFGGFDLAAIPIGSYAPRWFMKIMHVDAAEAVQAHRDVRARQSVGMHWGTFASLSDEDLHEPPRMLAAARAAAGLAEEDFFVMKHGETRRLTARADARNRR